MEFETVKNFFALSCESRESKRGLGVGVFPQMVRRVIVWGSGEGHVGIPGCVVVRHRAIAGQPVWGGLFGVTGLALNTRLPTPNHPPQTG